MSPEEIWQATMGEMELSLSKANFTTWFKGTRIVEHSDKKAIIGVPNNFTKEWLRTKYHQQLSQILRKFIPDLLTVEYIIVSSTTPNQIPQVESVKKAVSSEKTASKTSSSTFNPKYTFENFIVGNNNRLAHATSSAICEKPGEIYNPLFIYGGVGLGKTHLVHAIGNEIQKRYPGKRVLYVSCEKFTNEFIQAISAGKINDFKNNYRNVDVLLVDDIQFLSHKEGTQEEFFHTFNALHQTNRQIVITSDRVHTAIPDLEDRLSSRFGWGMVADVRTPNLETRLAILQTKCAEKKFTLDENILEYVAQNITTNIRELEGVLNRIITHCTLYKTSPTIQIVQELLEDVVSTNRPKNITPNQIFRAIVKFFDITLEDLMGPKRNKELVYPRQLAMYLLRHEVNMSFPHIGRELGGKDHTTVMHGCGKVEKELATKPSLQQDISSIKEILYN